MFIPRHRTMNASQAWRATYNGAERGCVDDDIGPSTLTGREARRVGWGGCRGGEVCKRGTGWGKVDSKPETTCRQRELSRLLRAGSRWTLSPRQSSLLLLLLLLLLPGDLHLRTHDKVARRRFHPSSSPAE